MSTGGRPPPSPLPRPPTRTATFCRSSCAWPWEPTASTIARGCATRHRWRRCCRSLGSGATSNSYLDYEKAGCLIIAGCDPSANHPVAATRFRKAVDLYGAKLIVINPKRIELCDYAYLWLREKPGTDVALFNGMAKVILDEGLADEQFVAERTEGFEEWKASLAQYTPDFVESITGVPRSR